MYKSQFQIVTLYDWFCGPGSHTVGNGVLIFKKTYYKYYINWIKVVQTIHPLYSKSSEAKMMVIVIECSHKAIYMTSNNLKGTLL